MRASPPLLTRNCLRDIACLCAVPCTLRYADGLGRLGRLLQSPYSLLRFIFVARRFTGDSCKHSAIQHTRDIHVLHREAGTIRARKLHNWPVLRTHERR